MLSSERFSRINTSELKSKLFKKLGRLKTEEYFYILKKLLSRKLSKIEFDKLCCGIVGKENLVLHNLFIRSILHNAGLGVELPSKSAVTGNSRTTNVCSNCDPFSPSPQRGASVNSMVFQLVERSSTLGLCGNVPLGKIVKHSSDLQKSGEQLSLPDLASIGSKPLLGLATVEDGEEVEQVTMNLNDQYKSPIKPPLGVSLFADGCPHRVFRSCCGSGSQESCCSTSGLPDSISLKKRLEERLRVEGLNMSLDCANLLNHGLDALLKKVIKPSMDLARARCNTRRTQQLDRRVVPIDDDLQIPNYAYRTSLLDFRVAMESNTSVLGSDWPIQLEKIGLYLSED